MSQLINDWKLFSRKQLNTKEKITVVIATAITLLVTATIALGLWWWLLLILGEIK